MLTRNQGSVWAILGWQYKSAIFYVAAGLVAWGLHSHHSAAWHLPSLPLAVIGGALGIFVSFRTNTSYARWWEGRQLWGRMVNSSRQLTLQLSANLVIEDEGERRRALTRLLYRHGAYVHALRAALREQPAIEDEELRALLPQAELDGLKGVWNVPFALLRAQAEELAALRRAGALDGLQHHSLDVTLAALLDIQGGCERIKGTPIPRGYGYAAELLVQIYAVMLPFGLVAELGPLIVLLNLIVCMAFNLISEVGRVLEDPFTMFYNGLPLSDLSRKIEINLRQTLGETELPPLRQPAPNGVLM